MDRTMVAPSMSPAANSLLHLSLKSAPCLKVLFYGNCAVLNAGNDEGAKKRTSDLK